MPLFIVIAALLCIVIYAVLLVDYRKPGVLEKLHGKAVKTIKDGIPPKVAESFLERRGASVPPRYAPLADLILRCGEGNRVFGGNSFEIITSGARKRELLLRDIEGAKDFIFMEYFRFGNDAASREVLDALAKKAEEGVEVCLLRNNMVGLNIPGSFFRAYERRGVKIIPYTHIRHGLRKWIMRIDHQNHRKTVVIDGRVSYTGGMNISDNYFLRWRDTHLRLCGPVSARLTLSFMDNWMCSGGSFRNPSGNYFREDAAHDGNPYTGKTVQVATDAPEYPFETTRIALEWILDNAGKYVFIQTPYFIPPDSFLASMKGAAARGVDVRLMLPRKTDAVVVGPLSRSFIGECLGAGIKVYLHDGSFIHSKMMVADDGIAVIGASNIDYRSFSRNTEVNTFIYEDDVAADCRKIFLRDAESSQEVEGERWKKAKKWYRKPFLAFLRLYPVRREF